MMKAPLFLFFSVFFICLFSSCEKTYYHHGDSFSHLKGKVKKITDTVYAVVPVGGDPLLPIQTVEYSFDSVNRLAEQKSCTFKLVESILFEEGYDTMLCSTQCINHRYDRDGRKVETLIINRSYENDNAVVSRIAMTLIKQDNNHEKWEWSSSDNLKDDVTKCNMDVYYSKDTITVVLADMEGMEKSRSSSVFDSHKNLIEIKEVKGDTSYVWAKYQYDSENLLTDIVQKAANSSDEVFSTSYQHDEFDNEGNWLKRFEYNADGKLINVIQRRIEYGR